MSKLPLDNILVLDLSTGPAGGLSTMILADFGARVLRPDRPETAPAARSWLRGKRTVDDDQEIDDYTWHADVMLVTSPPEKYRARAMQERNPRLVYCEITAMGQNHPMPLHEPLVAAKAGRMKSLEGIHPQPGPVYAAVQVATHACAQNAVSGILAALLERDRSGKGQQVHTSLLQGLMTYDTGLSLGLQIREKRGWPPFEMDPFTMMPSLNYHPVVCKDGRWLQLGNLLPHLFQRFMQVIGLGDELAKDAYKGPALQWAAADREALRDRILQTMQTKTAAEWMDLFVADGGVACHPWQSGEECLDDPDMVANGHVVEIDGVRQPGPVARLTLTPARPGTVKDYTPEALPEPADPGPTPLHGITVLELSTIIAAPLGASLLADLGARVIKVEPVGGDPYRHMGPGSIGAGRVNQGKESIGIDLKSAEGRDIVRRLAAKADVLIHNYRPGVPERLGISWEELSAINPGLVYLSCNGYGPEGPGARRPSTHPIPGAAVGGALYQAGGLPAGPGSLAEIRETSRRLMRANEVNPDPNTALVVCSSTLLALMGRRQTGKGQQVFIDMFGANAWANFDDFLHWEGKPPRPPLDEHLKGTGPLNRLYQAAKGWVFLGITGDGEWHRFCELTGVDWFHAFRQPPDDLQERLTGLFAGREAAVWETLLLPAGVGCVQADGASAGEFFLQDSRQPAPRWMQKVESSMYGSCWRHRPAIDFSRSGTSAGGPTAGGIHSRRIMQELGYSATDTQRYLQEGILWSSAKEQD